MIETKEWWFVDKSEWKVRGEWDNEPDKVQWHDAASGLACMIHRGPSGAWCGYVGVPASHPLHGKDYNHADVDVHGGLTFADKCAEQRKDGGGICHEVSCAADDGVWWLGFDCAHSEDFCPKYGESFDHYSTYKCIGYAKAETVKLAWQLAEQSKP